MRRIALLCSLTGLALASTITLACGDDASPTPTVVQDAPPSTLVPVIEATPDIPRDPRISESVVAGMLPSPAEASAALGLPLGTWVLEAALAGPWDPDGFRLVRPGITAGWIASLDTRSELAGLALDFYFHNTPEDAERTYQFIRGFFGREVEDEQGTIADAFWMGTIGPANSADVPVTSALFGVRQGTVFAFGSMQPGEDRDVSAGLREFARILALGIDEFLRAQGP